jgi:myo-inositol-1(or 4)-monophosphatase
MLARGEPMDALMARTALGSRLAVEAGEILMRHFSRLEGYEHKGPLDLVTAADKESEAYLVTSILEAFPEDSVLAEEDGEHGGGRSGYLWIIDPLDGTTNFVHSHPQFSVSIALTRAGEGVFGAVNAPVRGELFLATKGHGATLNGKRIEVSDKGAMSESLIASGFAYDRRERMDLLLSRLAKILHAARGFRREGAAAQDLCSVAAGRLDGYWEDNLNAWDVAAGAVILEEAGGKLSGFDGGPHDVFARNTVATNGRIHAELLATLFGG